MADEKKRERRIRDSQRMKAKARRIYPDSIKAHYWADRLAVCSCAMCGNPRHVWKDGARTMQERRCVLREADQD